MNNLIEMDIPNTIMNNRELDSPRFILPSTANPIDNNIFQNSTLDLFNYIFEVSSVLSILHNPVDSVSEEVPPMYQESDPHPDKSPPSFT